MNKLLLQGRPTAELPSQPKDHFAQLSIYLRLVGQEGDVDLCQSLDGFGRTALHQLVEQRIRAG